MRTRTTILAGLLVAVLVLSARLFLIAHRPQEPQPQRTREIGMTGWPIQKLSPEEERANHRRERQALREAIVQQETKVQALQEANTVASLADVEELQKQEAILAAMRNIEQESANKASEDIGAGAPNPQR